MLSATSVSERLPGQIIVSTKYLAFASLGTAANSETGDKAMFLQNIAAEVLSAEEAPLTIVEKVSMSMICLLYLSGIFQWEQISRIRFLEMKVDSRHCLAVAVSRTHESLFRRFAPYERKRPSASASLRQSTLILMISAFSKSVLMEGTSTFMLSVLIDWFISARDVHSMISSIAEQDDPAADLTAVAEYYCVCIANCVGYSCISLSAVYLQKAWRLQKRCQ